MTFFLEMRFEDNGFRAIVHLATTLTTRNEEEAREFVLEMRASMDRRELRVISINYSRIDNNPELRENLLRFYEFYKSRATATVEIEQFFLDNPDQAKSLGENMIEKFFNGENSTAQIGSRYKLPVRVMDRETRNPIAGDIYYLNLEHLIPR